MEGLVGKGLCVDVWERGAGPQVVLQAQPVVVSSCCTPRRGCLLGNGR